MSEKVIIMLFDYCKQQWLSKWKGMNHADRKIHVLSFFLYTYHYIFNNMNTPETRLILTKFYDTFQSYQNSRN